MDTKPVSQTRQPFDPEREECWGWWWNPDLAQEIDEEWWPKWTDDDPFDWDRVKNWYLDNELAVPVKPVYAQSQPAPVVQARAVPVQPVESQSQPVKRAAPNARVKGGVAIETRDAGKRARRMKRYMVWWRQADAARKAGLPEPPRPAEGFGDPDERGDDEPVH